MVGFNTSLNRDKVVAPVPEVPLLQTGPGGDYGRAYYGRGRRLTASAPLLDLPAGSTRKRTGLLVGPLTLLERLIGIDHCPTDIDRAGRRSKHASKSAPVSADAPDHATHDRTLDELAIRCTPTTEDVQAACLHTQTPMHHATNDRGPVTLPVTRVRQLTRMKSADERHTQATADTESDTRLPARQWLFSDDAGTGRSGRRQQSHGLRTRRSTRAKRNRQARAEQGSLFVNL